MACPWWFAVCSLQHMQVEATTTWADRGERKDKVQSTQSSLVEGNSSKSDSFCLGDYAEGFPQCHQPLIRRSPPVYPFSHLRSYHATLTTSSKSSRLYSVQCLLLRPAIQYEYCVRITHSLSMAAVPPSHTVHTSSTYIAVSQFTRLFLPFKKVGH